MMTYPATIADIMTEDNDEPEYISVTEAAERLDISRSGVLKHITRGNLPAQKIGNQYIIKTTDLERVRDLKPGPKPDSN